MRRGTRRKPAHATKPSGTRRSPPTRAKYPQEAAEFKRRMTRSNCRPTGRKRRRRSSPARTSARKPSRRARRRSRPSKGLSAVLPELLGGSADLTGSNLTNWKAAKPVRVNAEGQAAGNYVNYGVREFGMSAAINGIALHGGFKAVRRHVPDVLGLQPQRAARRRADESAVDLRVHARLDRSGRRRPDPPVDRTRGEPASDSAPASVASGRYRRDGGGLDRMRSNTTARRA